ncbi:hypothetical protein WILLOW_24 [Paenibacillus phage Willow]|uniref:Uncharacterized protein n=2 Tax=Fernvirus fern TaxID=2845736 RepID=A0A0K2CXN6_9CAUD|nr:hypothetical protein FERN_24 [Paenibacillus phage Fern]YP_009593433.1 hypothetical protein FDG84_gp24 [Paenibacillus phage Willow]ALA12334.1 hypothetical protein FERN_24 [Paenibacillus phage Fern]ALA12402.1 hypothetical protein WILLOW_24 [Paenibacillus phage Willow]
MRRRDKNAMINSYFLSFLEQVTCSKKITLATLLRLRGFFYKQLTRFCHVF